MCTSLHLQLEVDSIRCMFVEAHSSLTMSHGRHFDTCPHHTAHTLPSWLGWGHCRADTPSAPNAGGGSHPAPRSWAGWAQWRSHPGCTSSTPCVPTYRGYVVYREDTVWTQHEYRVFMPINLSQTVRSLTAMIRSYVRTLSAYLITQVVCSYISSVYHSCLCLYNHVHAALSMYCNIHAYYHGKQQPLGMIDTAALYEVLVQSLSNQS